MQNYKIFVNGLYVGTQALNAEAVKKYNNAGVTVKKA